MASCNYVMKVFLFKTRQILVIFETNVNHVCNNINRNFLFYRWNANEMQKIFLSDL